MKNVLYFILFAATLCGCSKDKDLFTPKETMTDEQRLDYAERTLGVSIDKRHDWVLSEKYQVKIVANANMDDICEVRVLSDNPYLASAQSMAVVPATAGQEVNVEFRAPLAKKLFHAACINTKGEINTVAFVAGTDSVSFVKKPSETIEKSAPMRRSKLNEDVVTVDDDLLYIPWNRPDYPQLQEEALLFVPKVFPEGQNSNRPQVLALNNHSLLTDWIGGQVTMTFLGGRTDNATTHIGYRIYPIEDPSNVQTYIINDRFNTSSSDALKNFMTDETKVPVNYSGQKVALVWKDHTGNFRNALPANMKVDFFVVVDGQDMSSDSIRVTVYSVNGRTYLSCEDGVDDTFNDKMFYIEEGIITAPNSEDITPEPLQPQVWTYAWEDKDKGDYDMNDCVIQVVENANDVSKLDITLLAAGAQRDLRVYFAANDADVFGRELHDVLGVRRGALTNTYQKDVEPVTVTCQKPLGFDFQTNAFKLLVKYPDDEAKEFGKTTYYVSLPGKGQDPHAIAIPVKWSWPLEKVSVIAAYPKFRNWAQDMTNVKAQDWYLYPDSDKVMRIE